MRDREGGGRENSWILTSRQPRDGDGGREGGEREKERRREFLDFKVTSTATGHIRTEGVGGGGGGKREFLDFNVLSVACDYEQSDLLYSAGPHGNCVCRN